MRAFMTFGTLGASGTTFKPGFARSATLVTAASFFGVIKRILLRAHVRDGRRQVPDFAPDRPSRATDRNRLEKEESPYSVRASIMEPTSRFELLTC
jgi:hypothetical protein